MKAWLGACVLLGGGAALGVWATGFVPPLQSAAVHPLAWDAVHWVTRPWTLWTAAWVHTSAGNFAANLLALVALAVAGAALGAGRAAALTLLAAWPLGTLALLLWPQVTSYAGLGGPIHAAAAVLGVHLARHPTLKPLSTLIFAGLSLKLIAERAWSQPVAFDPSWGFNVVYAAHLTGAFCGGALGVIALRVWPLLRPARESSPPGPSSNSH